MPLFCAASWAARCAAAAARRPCRRRGGHLGGCLLGGGELVLRGVDVLAGGDGRGLELHLFHRDDGLGGGRLLAGHLGLLSRGGGVGQRLGGGRLRAGDAGEQDLARLVDPAQLGDPLDGVAEVARRDDVGQRPLRATGLVDGAHVRREAGLVVTDLLVEGCHPSGVGGHGMVEGDHPCLDRGQLLLRPGQLLLRGAEGGARLLRTRLGVGEVLLRLGHAWGAVRPGRQRDRGQGGAHRPGDERATTNGEVHAWHTASPYDPTPPMSQRRHRTVARRCDPRSVAPTGRF